MIEDKTTTIEPGPEGDDLTKAVEKVAVLSVSRKRDNKHDPRPRFKDMDIRLLGGRVRFRRLTPEQQLTLHDNLRSAGVSTHAPDLSNVFVREAVAKCVHVGLCPTDSASLLLPGDEGRERVKRLPDDELLRCWKAAIDFNNIPIHEDE